MTVLSGFWFPGVVVSEVPDGRGLGACRRNRWQGAAKDCFLCLMCLNYWVVRHVWIC